MRRLVAGLAVGSAALLANAAFACDNKTESAEQSEKKPAVAEKAKKDTKRQQKEKKAEQSANTAVAQADKK
jgi:hypothetical protein